MQTASHRESRRTRLLPPAGVAILAVLLVCTPGPAPPWEPEYWLVVEPGRGSSPTQPFWLQPTLPIPVVRSLGVDVSRLHPPRPARLTLIGADVSLPIVAGQDRYVLDVSVGFRGLEPYQWTHLVIGAPDGRGRYWERSLRAVPGFQAEQP